MKNVVLAFLLIIIISGGVVAQTTVAASDVMAQINRGQAVTYKNVEIAGDLDLTQLNNKTLKEQSEDMHPNKVFISTVTAPLNFTNCTFTGKVMAYFNPDQGKINLNNNGSAKKISCSLNTRSWFAASKVLVCKVRAICWISGKSFWSKGPKGGATLAKCKFTLPSGSEKLRVTR